jgi:arylsulfatase A-like enzyme
MTPCPAGLATHRDSMQGKAGNRLSNPIPAAYIEHMKKRMLMLAVLALAPHLGAKPNFVFFLVDDLGWSDVACFGSTFHETPNIDALANTGMKFTDAYAACPVCSPTRASIMTGKYPARLNITDWIPGSSPKNRKLLGVEDLHQLPLEELCIAEALKAEGYATFFAGKWHLGNTGFFPEDQGFDVNIGGHHKGSPPGGYYSPWKNPKLENGKPGEYLTDRLGNETINWISGQAEKKRPFLAYLSFYNVHTPVQPCEKFIDHYKAKARKLPVLKNPTIKEHEGSSRVRQDNPAFASMVAAMDDNVGRVLDTLKKLGIDDHTVVIFTSDNGGLCTLQRNRTGSTSNAPLRAGKGWCYEGGIRVATIIRAPGITKPGSVCKVPVTSTDFYPTMLELAGLALKPKQHVDGLSLVPLLKGGKTLDREALYWHYPHYHGSAWEPGASVRMGDWKLIEFYEDEKAELYRLRDDIGERKELSAEFPEKKEELLAKLHAWQKRIGAKMPQPNPAFSGK